MNPIAQQKRVLNILGRLLANGKVPHALLFHGPDGLGKSETARLLAMAQNCEDAFWEGRTPDRDLAAPVSQDDPPLHALFDGLGPCGKCGPCGKILSENHPDILTIKKEGAAIKIAQVRELLGVLGMRPAEGRTRVVLVLGAQDMTREAANSLLKVLEEPPGATVFILVCREPSDLLPTIVSRCHAVGFSPVAASWIGRYLESRKGLPRDRAELLAQASGGSLEKALELAEKGGLSRMEFWSKALNKLESLQGTPSSLAAMALAELWAQDKKQSVEDLGWIRMLLRDRLVARYCPELVFSDDQTSGNSQRPVHLSAKALFQCERDLLGNVNPRLALEELMLHLARAPRPRA